jgi:outer membrane murein-binding lipoprotein Lpp
MEPSSKLDKLNERVIDIETTLKGLKLAATVLGISGAVILGALWYVGSQAAKANQTASDASKLAGDVTKDLETKKEAAIKTLETAGKARQQELAKAFADGVTNGIFKVEPDQQKCVEDAHNNCPDGFDLKCPDGMVMVYQRNYGGGNTCIRKWRCCALAIRKVG